MSEQADDYFKQIAMKVDRLACVPGKESTLARFRKQIGIYLQQENERRKAKEECEARINEHARKIAKDARLRDKDAGPPSRGWVWDELGHPDDPSTKIEGWRPPDLYQRLENDEWLHGFCPKTDAEALPYYYTKLAIVHDHELRNVPPVIDDKVLPPEPFPHKTLGELTEAEGQEFSRHFRYYLPLMTDLKADKLSEFTGYDRISIEIAFEHVKADLEPRPSFRAIVACLGLSALAIVALGIAVRWPWPWRGLIDHPHSLRIQVGFAVMLVFAFLAWFVPKCRMLWIGALSAMAYGIWELL